MPQWVKFTADYDHIWPSRAHTAYKAGMILFVKNEVAEAAMGAGKAEETEKPEDSHRVTVYDAEDAAPSQASDRPPADGVAEPDDATDVGPELRAEADESAAERQ